MGCLALALLALLLTVHGAVTDPSASVAARVAAAMGNRTEADAALVTEWVRRTPRTTVEAVAAFEDVAGASHPYAPTVRRLLIGDFALSHAYMLRLLTVRLHEQHTQALVLRRDLAWFCERAHPGRADLTLCVVDEAVAFVHRYGVEIAASTVALTFLLALTVLNLPVLAGGASFGMVGTSLVTVALNIVVERLTEVGIGDGPVGLAVSVRTLVQIQALWLAAKAFTIEDHSSLVSLLFRLVFGEGVSIENGPSAVIEALLTALSILGIIGANGWAHVRTDVFVLLPMILVSRLALFVLDVVQLPWTDCPLVGSPHYCTMRCPCPNWKGSCGRNEHCADGRCEIGEASPGMWAYGADPGFDFEGDDDDGRRFAGVCVPPLPLHPKRCDAAVGCSPFCPCLHLEHGCAGVDECSGNATCWQPWTPLGQWLASPKPLSKPRRFGTDGFPHRDGSETESRSTCFDVARLNCSTPGLPCLPSWCGCRAPTSTDQCDDANPCYSPVEDCVDGQCVTAPECWPPGPNEDACGGAWCRQVVWDNQIRTRCEAS